jgi:hypothetical protein
MADSIAIFGLFLEGNKFRNRKKRAAIGIYNVCNFIGACFVREINFCSYLHSPSLEL